MDSLQHPHATSPEVLHMDRSNVHIACTQPAKPTDATDGPFRFLDLPPELRERIYTHLVVPVAPISLQQQFKEPHISRVSRLVREESLDVFYCHTTFGIDNSGGDHETMQKLSNTLSHIHESSLARIRHLRLDWNTHCQASMLYCFNTEPQHTRHLCSTSSDSRPPVYLVACYITLTLNEPWFELCINAYEYELSTMTAKPLYEKMHDVITATLEGRGPADRRRKQLTAQHLVDLAKLWDYHACALLRESSWELLAQHKLSIPGNANGITALQDYQMQLMLLEQQKKKRLLMARLEQSSKENPGRPRSGNGRSQRRV